MSIMYPEKVLEDSPPDTDNPVHTHYASHGDAGPGCVAACGRRLLGAFHTKEEWMKKPCPECLEARTGLREPVQCKSPFA